ncbi:MAG: response regulator transcription factor [Chloroflexi bacterium]|uniref:Response regulator transcription factor n=1 Tax=Candidatus Chlorohelix allophototropha TaxID=3003348 RepID=A0A8T7M5D3_9CHLR|nr:response regulator transcription factor [Chloroflexota bacterium]WJW69113.1 response regulator transcription factor [Chloroflexota bacterium L227-S17]
MSLSISRLNKSILVDKQKMEKLQKKILIIEDEATIRLNLEYLLEVEGFQILSASDGNVGIQIALQQKPDLIISDIIMPEMSGYEVLEALRNNPTTLTIPFIFLTAKAAKGDLRYGMELGADDYLTKPFTQRELLQSVKTRLEKQAREKSAILQPISSELQLAANTIKQMLNSIELDRYEQFQAEQKNLMVHSEASSVERSPIPSNSIIKCNGLLIDTQQHLVTVEGKVFKLSPRQYEVLKLLAENAGRILSHKSILLSVWGPEYEQETQYLHVFISQLRQKIEPDPSNPRYIFTTRGYGYHLAAVQ